MSQSRHETFILLVRRDSGRGLTFASLPYSGFPISESINRLYNSAIRRPFAIIVKSDRFWISRYCKYPLVYSQWKKNILISDYQISYIFVLYYNTRSNIFMLKKINIHMWKYLFFKHKNITSSIIYYINIHT